MVETDAIMVETDAIMVNQRLEYVIDGAVVRSKVFREKMSFLMGSSER